jgi:hypothetical protein
MIIIGLTFMALVLSISCEKDEVVGPVEKESTIFNNNDIMNLEVDNIGEIHNEILEEFDREHDLSSKERLHPEEFIELTVRSINKVFNHRNIPCQISHNDIKFIISKFVEIQQEGAYDFFSYSSEDLRNVKPLFRYLEENMGLNRNTSNICIQIADIIKNESRPVVCIYYLYFYLIPYFLLSIGIEV